MSYVAFRHVDPRTAPWSVRNYVPSVYTGTEYYFDCVRLQWEATGEVRLSQEQPVPEFFHWLKSDPSGPLKTATLT